ncbi:hypothetical protein BM523_08140 [Alteromonas mediterranea]|uniref:GIY-YIG nuclease family protein n=1 Tax=Alteromonas mediterranea TaxID=314275 RepID=UPI0009045571|nr:GIY-YIG nuclease family protein [Alteromonas mediterranea]APD93959.1 hypothetical protein BM523_08140 [Alteromonas mediterranea]APD97586.1 hypothetical protein BM525_08175 [Alteromonas mediterranea]
MRNYPEHYVYLFVYPALDEFKIGITNSLIVRSSTLSAILKTPMNDSESWALVVPKEQAIKVERGLLKLLNPYNARRNSFCGATEFFHIKGLVHARELFLWNKKVIKDSDLLRGLSDILSQRPVSIIDFKADVDKSRNDQELFESDCKKAISYLHRVITQLSQQDRTVSLSLSVINERIFVYLHSLKYSGFELKGFIRRVVSYLRKLVPFRFVGNSYKGLAINNFTTIYSFNDNWASGLFHRNSDDVLLCYLSKLSTKFSEVPEDVIKALNMESF